MEILNFNKLKWRQVNRQLSVAEVGKYWLLVLCIPESKPILLIHEANKYLLRLVSRPVEQLLAEFENPQEDEPNRVHLAERIWSSDSEDDLEPLRMMFRKTRDQKTKRLLEADYRRSVLDSAGVIDLEEPKACRPGRFVPFSKAKNR